MITIKNILRTISIAPFKAFIPNSILAKHIISPPYDVLTTIEAKKLAEDNERSFLHCIKPEIDLPSTINCYSSEVYQKGKENLSNFISSNFLIPDFTERVYIYCINANNHSQYGILCASSIKEYENKIIKAHELTREIKVIDRLSLIDMQNANTEPVLLLYRHKDFIDELIYKISKSKPEIDCITDDGIQHILWKCEEKYTQTIIDEFVSVSYSYIADGHHRTESSAKLAQQRRKLGKENNTYKGYEYFLTVLFPDNQLKVLEYNRVIKKMPESMTKTIFFSQLMENFHIYDIFTPKPTKKHQFSMFYNNKWIGLELKIKNHKESIIYNIDSYLLTKFCLDPILKIKDITKSDNIDFIGGIKGSKEIEKRCREDCSIGFMLFPLDVNDIISVADAGSIMPPKSTWFEPKPRSGIAVRLIEE